MMMDAGECDGRPIKDVSPKKTQFGLNHPRVRKFTFGVGPQIVEYASRMESELEDAYKGVLVVPIMSGGMYFGMSLRAYLLSEGLDVEYYELPKKSGTIPERLAKGRVVIMVDDAVYSGKTMNLIRARLGRMRNMKQALDNPNGRKWVYAVEEDVLEQADFSCGGDLRLDKLDVRMRELNEKRDNYTDTEIRIMVEEAIERDFTTAEQYNARQFAYATLGLSIEGRDAPALPHPDVIRDQEKLYLESLLGEGERAQPGFLTRVWRGSDTGKDKPIDKIRGLLKDKNGKERLKK